VGDQRAKEDVTMLFQNDPFRDIDALLGRMGTRSSFTPSAMPMDAYRRENTVWVHIDLPGVTPESIDVGVERSVLTVTAERSWDRKEDDRVYLQERRTGTFTRQVHLGDGLDANAIQADYEDGVLTLRIPFAEQAQPRKISIGSGGRAAIDVESSDSDS
jgi:HSP20 family protein